MRVADTARFLLGSWSVERVISDHVSGLAGSFRGTAEVRHRPDGPDGTAHYDEVGTLRFGARDGSAARGLICVRQADGTVLFTFRDGRRFVDCDLRSGTWPAEHTCGADHYTLAFHACSRDVLEELWWVRGPAKNYDARTIFRRLDGPAPADPTGSAATGAGFTGADFTGTGFG